MGTPMALNVCFYLSHDCLVAMHFVLSALACVLFASLLYEHLFVLYFVLSNCPLLAGTMTVHASM